MNYIKSYPWLSYLKESLENPIKIMIIKGLIKFIYTYFPENQMRIAKFNEPL